MNINKETNKNGITFSQHSTIKQFVKNYFFF